MEIKKSRSNHEEAFKKKRITQVEFVQCAKRTDELLLLLEKWAFGLVN